MTGMKDESISPEKDIDDEGFLNAPAVLITSDDIIEAAEVDTMLSPAYKRCSNCILRDTEPPCKYFEHGAVCQIERNMFKSYLLDLQSRDVEIKDRITIMAGFIHWINLWRTYAIESAKDESYAHSTPEGAKLSQFRHKVMNDHSKNLMSTLRELEATKKSEPKTKKKKTDSPLANLMSEQ